EQPVEQRSGLVAVVRDETVHRHRGVHDDCAHGRSSASGAQRLAARESHRCDLPQRYAHRWITTCVVVRRSSRIHVLWITGGYLWEIRWTTAVQSGLRTTCLLSPQCRGTWSSHSSDTLYSVPHSPPTS